MVLPLFVPSLLGGKYSLLFFKIYVFHSYMLSKLHFDMQIINICYSKHVPIVKVGMI